MEANNNMAYNQPINVPPVQPKKPIAFAIVSFVLGVCSILFYCVWIVSVLCALFGTIFGIVALGKRQGFKGMAIAGLAISLLVLGFYAVTFFAHIFSFNLFVTWDEFLRTI
ncbi:MAG: DUF4190 domain-containing protein [Ruminococcus sp.]|nr:DUF4190 domain-containing protein [Ruminococcus sp.]